MSIQFFALFGLSISVILLLLGLCLRATDGLFFSRTPQRFKSDRHDPNYEVERQVGLKVSNGLLRFSPGALCFFTLILLFTLLGIF